MYSPIQITSFLPKLRSKILFFRKLVSTFCSSHNSNSIVKNSESPPIRDLVHDHIQDSRLIGFTVVIQMRRVVQEYLLGEKKRYTKSCSLLGIEKSCIDLAKAILSRGAQGVDFGMYQNQDKENLKRVA